MRNRLLQSRDGFLVFAAGINWCCRKISTGIGTYTGMARGEAAETMISIASILPQDCVIVEIGSFLGATSVLLAGARKTSGSGKLHCVDPFDGSGDSFSVPVYRELLEQHGAKTQRERFENNIRTAGVQD